MICIKVLSIPIQRQCKYITTTKKSASLILNTYQCGLVVYYFPHWKKSHIKFKNKHMDKLSINQHFLDRVLFLLLYTIDFSEINSSTSHLYKINNWHYSL